MRLRVAGLLLALTLAPLASARADFKDFGGPLCLAGAIQTCASIQVETFALAGGGTRVLIRVRNFQGAIPDDNTLGSIITRIGLTGPGSIGTATLISVSGPTGGGAPAGLWRAQNSPGQGNIGGLTILTAGTQNNNGGILGCAASNANPSSYFQTCGSSSAFVVFEFTTTGNWSAHDAEVAWKIQAAAVDGGSYNCRSEDANCAPLPPPTVVPEPITTTLLGTGLAALGGLGLRRRRRGKNIENG